MKQVFFITSIIFLLSIFACKKDRNKTMTVIKDCTGTYLRLDGKDYHVCNLEKVSAYTNGAKIPVTFKILEDCAHSKETITCYMLHKNEGWIEVEKIK